MTTTNELKQKIEKVILESYNKSKEKNFTDLNFSFPKNNSVIAFLKSKLKVFNKLDPYSQTFLSIHTRAKITLREFQQQKFEGNHLELLRLVLTLSDTLGHGNLKSTGTREKVEQTIVVVGEKNTGKTLESNKRIERSKLKENTILVQPGMTGKKVEKQKQKQQIEIEEIQDIDFEDEEFTNDANNLDDVEL